VPLGGLASLCFGRLTASFQQGAMAELLTKEDGYESKKSVDRKE
jgi:hypothetical protein